MTDADEREGAADVGALVAELWALLGADGVRDDDDARARYGRDETRRWPAQPCAVALPRSAAEVAAVLRAAAAAGVAVVPSGGRTGLAGGAVAARGELVLSLERMAAIGVVDAVGRTVRVEAGATNAAVQAAALPFGLHWPVDLASKGSATIGGNVATNAGGVRVIRYGHARAWVAGVEAVLADGSHIVAGGATVKDNTGIDLRGLFIGSEGTLGVLTALTLRLAPLPRAAEVCLFALNDLRAALAVLERARGLDATLGALEVVDARCLRAVLAAHPEARPPFVPLPPYALLCELEPAAEGVVELARAAAELDGVRDVVIATDAQQRRALWLLREGVSAALAPRRPHKNDVAVPLAALAAFVAELEAWTRGRPEVELALFGHLGDGSLHINALRPEGVDEADFLAGLPAADRALFALVRGHGGSISAEHGVGLLKAPYLGLQHDEAAIAAMRAVKRALDPRGLLNPGKVFDVGAAGA